MTYWTCGKMGIGTCQLCVILSFLPQSPLCKLISLFCHCFSSHHGIAVLPWRSLTVLLCCLLQLKALFFFFGLFQLHCCHSCPTLKIPSGHWPWLVCLLSHPTCLSFLYTELRQLPCYPVLCKSKRVEREVITDFYLSNY